MKNYICINGKKAELTEEQMKALGIELPKANPFERVKKNERFYRIGFDGDIYVEYETHSSSHNELFNVANYCTDKSILEQRALHETLNRLLWRFVTENECEGKAWNHWGICSDCSSVYQSLAGKKLGEIIFNSEKMAKRALKEIVEPFIQEHPEFKF